MRRIVLSVIAVGCLLLAGVAAAQTDVPETLAPAAWPENMPADAERILQGLDSDPAATLQALMPEIAAQAQALPAMLAQGLRELDGETVAEPFGPVRLGFLIALGIFTFLGAIGLLRRSWLAVAMVFGLFVAPLLAAFTGFVALGLAVFALAVVSPLLAKLLPIVVKAALSRGAGAADDVRWRQHPGQVVPPRQSMPSPAARPAGKPAPHVSVARKIHAPPQAMRPPAPAMKHGTGAQAARPAGPPMPHGARGQPAPVDWLELKRQVDSVVGDVLPKPRGRYIAGLVILFVVAPPAAVIVLLALPLWYAYKVLTLDATRRERLLAIPRIREGLRQLQLQQPELYQALTRLQQTLNA